MSAERIAQALERIEAAASRIEAAASARDGGDSANGAADAELQARYDALRREASEAMRQIDGIIGTIEA